jgi:putative ABC transport system permease protein
MRGVLYLSLRRLRHHRLQSAIAIACLALAFFLPVASERLIARYDRDLGARAAASPLLAGARGSRFDLVLAALYFRGVELDPVRFADAEALRAGDEALVVPMHLRFRARGRPLVATTREYFERRGLRARSGSLPLLVGECVLGARVAAELALEVGDALFSDPREQYDIAKAPALKMRIVGVLAPRETPDDDAVFVDLATAWVLEGALHGHGEATQVARERSDLVLGQQGEHVVFSPALIEWNEITPENAASFHHHGDPGALPLSAVLLFPKDEKSGTLLKTRVNARSALQIVRPSEVIGDLMAFVFRIKRFVDVLWALLAVTTALWLGLVLLLSTRLRAAELETLHRLGASRGTALRLIGAELLLLLLVAAASAVALVLATLAWLPDLVRVL